MTTIEQLQSLQNAADYAGALTIHQATPRDTRHTRPKFFAQHRQATISPVLPYNEMNSFLQGYIKALQRR